MYYEPFLGSGAMFFRLAPARASLSDLNVDLINVFRMVSLHPFELVRRLDLLPSNRATMRPSGVAAHPIPWTEQSGSFTSIAIAGAGSIVRTGREISIHLGEVVSVIISVYCGMELWNGQLSCLVKEV
jgi:D12 class N6 adenine-specific DNA methyltransferase